MKMVLTPLYSIIKEYMTKNNKRYHAKVTRHDGRIKISEGGKPFPRGGFIRYIEVYLPSSYQNNLHVTSTNGIIDLTRINLDLSTLRVDNTSGTVKLDRAACSDIYLSSTRGALKLGMIKASRIRLETTSGSITCGEVNGRVTYKSTSGNLDVKSAIGSGSYRANNSGKLNVVYTEVTGDVSFFNKNDNIRVILPADLSFSFEATTKNGSVSTNFQQSLKVKGRTTSGIVGIDPIITVKVETKNGNSEVKQ
ncbi:MAG: DUF4097 domain-containing protein [Streptococcaceae bacterium]|jgi:DUF4097 and DUF4098 domain-containing protein YvlB|nr:DUF4097 domain-containing protein [Streptococcaceae bacterium]